MNFRKTITRLVASFIAVALVIVGFSNPVLAETSVPEGKTNLNFITQNEDKLEYTFTENGTDYKIIEYLSPNEVVSHYYQKDIETNEYKEYDVVTTTLLEEDGILEHESEYTGEVQETDLSSITDQDEGIMQIRMGSDGWRYSSTSYGNNIISRWTVGVIAITVASITKVPATAKWAINVANLTFQLSAKTVYTKYVYYKKGSGITRTTKTVRTMYRDSARNKPIASSVTESGRTGMKVTSRVIY